LTLDEGHWEREEKGLIPGGSGTGGKLAGEFTERKETKQAVFVQESWRKSTKQHLWKKKKKGGNQGKTIDD